MVWGQERAGGEYRSQVCHPDVDDWRQQNRVFEEIASFTGYWSPVLSTVSGFPGRQLALRVDQETGPDFSGQSAGRICCTSNPQPASAPDPFGLKSVLLEDTLASAALAFAQPVTESKSFGGKTVSLNTPPRLVRGRVGKLFGKDGTIGSDPPILSGAPARTPPPPSTPMPISSSPGSPFPRANTLYVDLTDPDNWQLVVNKQTGQWSLTYDKSRDLGRVKTTMTKPPAVVEALKYTIDDLGGNKANLLSNGRTTPRPCPSR